MKTMTKQAKAFALAHKINLGFDVETGFYFIAQGPAGWPHFSWRGHTVWDVSLQPTGRSALNMMRRLVRNMAAAKKDGAL